MSEHIDENAVVAFCESTLDDASRAVAEAHLATCAACRRLVAEYAEMFGASMEGAATELDSSTQKRTRKAEDPDTAELVRRLAHAQAAKRVGTTLCGKWNIVRLIGMGGMAHVFEGTHRNGRSVAVKILRAELALEAGIVQRFVREGYVANKLQHEGAVAVLDDDVTEDGAPFLVMELLRGKTLGKRLADDGPLPIDEALKVVADALDVLAAAHERGIVHRDIKPDNLFETEEGRIKVLDFGIARLRSHEMTETLSGVTMGTIGYMAPEQARGNAETVGARSDVWAVGATLFTLLSGKTVHDAPTPNEAWLLSMTAEVPPAKKLLPDLPDAVCAVLDGALAFDEKARFPDARTTQAAVRAARESLSAKDRASVVRVPTVRIASKPPAAIAIAQPASQASSAVPPSREKPARTFGAAIVAAVVVALAGAALLFGRPSRAIDDTKTVPAIAPIASAPIVTPEPPEPIDSSAPAPTPQPIKSSTPASHPSKRAAAPLPTPSVTPTPRPLPTTATTPLDPLGPRH